MRIGNSFKKKDITSESLKLKGKQDVDRGLREALTNPEDGLLRPGALPKMNTSSAAGNKLLLDAIDKAHQNSPMLSENLENIPSEYEYIWNHLCNISESKFSFCWMGLGSWKVFPTAAGAGSSKEEASTQRGRIKWAEAAYHCREGNKINADPAHRCGDMQNWINQAVECPICQRVVPATSQTCREAWEVLQRSWRCPEEPWWQKAQVLARHRQQRQHVHWESEGLLFRLKSYTFLNQQVQYTYVLIHTYHYNFRDIFLPKLETQHVQTHASVLCVRRPPRRCWSLARRQRIQSRKQRQRQLLSEVFQ